MSGRMEKEVGGMERQIRTVLGDDADDYDIPGIVAEIRSLYGPVTGINEIHGPVYLDILSRHEAKVRT